MNMVEEVTFDTRGVEHSVDDPPCDVDRWIDALATEAASHRAVHHPYLRRLAAGELPEMSWALRDHVTQYYGYSSHFPRYLTAVVSRLTDPEHRKLLVQNLLEEAGRLEPEERRSLERLGIDLAWIDGVPHPQLLQRVQESLRAHPFDDLNPDSIEVVCWREMFLSILLHGSRAEAIGALGLGTEGIVRYFFPYLLEALQRFSGLSRRDCVFFELHCVVDDGHAEALRRVARDLAASPEDRRDLRKGMLKALNLRAAVWDWMLERALRAGGKADV